MHWPEFEWYLTHDAKIDRTQKPPYFDNHAHQKKIEEQKKAKDAEADKATGESKEDGATKEKEEVTEDIKQE